MSEKLEYDGVYTPDPRLLENFDVFNYILASYKQNGPQSFVNLLELAIAEKIVTKEQCAEIWCMLVKLARKA